MGWFFLLKSCLFILAVTGTSATCLLNDTVMYIRMNEVSLTARKEDQVTYVDSVVSLMPTCLKMCDNLDNCTAFAVDYEESKCILYNRDILLENVIKSRRFSLFNKTCLTEDVQLPPSCGQKGWQVDLWLGWTLRDNGTVFHNVSKLQECIILCLNDSLCGSVSFGNSSCIIHEKSSRRSPKNIEAKKGMVLVDNWCQKDALNTCAFSSWTGLVTVNADRSSTLPSAKDCEEMCKKSEDIPCWTYTYNETSRICSLSADNNMLIPDKSNEGVYGERQCVPHGRWTRAGACVCDVTAGGGHNDPNLVHRLVTLVHDVGKAVYDAANPGHTPETACQCVEKPNPEVPKEPEPEVAMPVQQNPAGKPVIVNNYFPEEIAPPSNNFPGSGGYPGNYYPNRLQGFYNPYYVPGEQGR